MIRAEYVDHMGDDLSVVNAARVSFDKVSEWEWVECGVKAFGNESYQTISELDVKLIRYLARNNHWTPFAHTSISLRMGAPISIRTQCFKHKQGFVENEESRRYISSRPEVYVPDEFRSAAENVKQGSGKRHKLSDIVRLEYMETTKHCVESYMRWIKNGICPEQARFILPQGCVVNWIWTGNLASFARFYKQRTHDKAQKEIQYLAHSVSDVIKPLYPFSWDALTGSST